MNATGEIARVEPSENIASPTIVYFWGPVRDHVNRIAAEYVARLGSEPVWMNVDAGNSAAAPSPDVIPLAGENVFELSPGPEPKFLAAGPDRLALEGPSKGTAQVVEGRPQVVFHFPPIGPVVLREDSGVGAGGAFVLSNIDRLDDPARLLDPGSGASLLASYREKGVVLVLTSEGLLPMPHAESECAVEVVSMPDEQWWEAEVRPGVPFNAGSEAEGPDSEGYATGFPELRPDNPLMAKWAGQATKVTDPADIYPAGIGLALAPSTTETN